MSNVKDLIGFKYEPYSFGVEKSKIKEFVTAIGDENPIYTDINIAKKEGYKGIPIPLTYLQVIDTWGGYSFEEKMNLLKLNPVKILHGEQEYNFFDEIYAGDFLTVTSEVIDVNTKKGSSGGMDLITTEYRYVNQNNVLVAISKNTTIHRH